jgi:hypothetical protein
LKDTQHPAARVGEIQKRNRKAKEEGRKQWQNRDKGMGERNYELF